MKMGYDTWIKKFGNFFHEISHLFEDGKIGGQGKLLRSFTRDGTKLHCWNREEIIFSTSLEKGAFVLPSADGLLMGF